MVLWGKWFVAWCVNCGILGGDCAWGGWCSDTLVASFVVVDRSGAVVGGGLGEMTMLPLDGSVGLGVARADVAAGLAAGGDGGGCMVGSCAGFVRIWWGLVVAGCLRLLG